MRLHEVLEGAPEGTRIRRRGWRFATVWRVDKSGTLFVGDDCACLSVDNATATDWERVPTDAEIAALERAMLEAAQKAMALAHKASTSYINTGLFSDWTRAKAAYEAAKGAI